MEIITPEAIEKAKNMFPGSTATTQASMQGKVDLDAYFTHYGIPFKKKMNGQGTIHSLTNGCLFDASHTKHEASIIQMADGKLVYQCFHQSCNHTWKEARELISGKDSLQPFIWNGDTKVADEIKEEKNLWASLPTGSDLQAMEINIEWLIDKILPMQSTSSITGKGGTGKSTLVLNMMDAVTKGEPFLGNATKKMDALYVDFENPLPVVVERVRELGVTDVKFWHNGMTPKPPRIDSPEYTEYLKIQPCLIAVDSLRASQSGDENSSKDMGLAMSRYNELRDFGHTIIIIQHTQKANERMFRGSMAISDLVDHPIYFYPVRNVKSDEAVEDMNIDDLPFYLGTTEKTRFHHFKTYIKRAGKSRFVVAVDPDIEKIEAICELCKDQAPMNQSEIVKLVYKELGYERKRTRHLLEKGIGKFWDTKKEGKSIVYHLSICPPINRGGQWDNRTDRSKTIKTNCSETDLQPIENKVLSHSSGASGTIGTIEEDDFIPEIEEGEVWD